MAWRRGAGQSRRNSLAKRPISASLSGGGPGEEGTPRPAGSAARTSRAGGALPPRHGDGPVDGGGQSVGLAASGLALAGKGKGPVREVLERRTWIDAVEEGDHVGLAGDALEPAGTFQPLYVDVEAGAAV